MTKRELKKILLIYPKIRRAVLENKSYAGIERYGRKRVIEIPSWAKLIEKSIESIMQIGDKVVCTIVEQAYLKGCRDREIYMRLPISESSYYRIKRDIEGRIYEMCIVNGYVTEEDILENDIW